jgi:hypothetical protein
MNMNDTITTEEQEENELFITHQYNFEWHYLYESAFYTMFGICPFTWDNL